MSSCQAAVAEALQVYGRIDVLFCCCSEGKFTFPPDDCNAGRREFVDGDVAIVGAVEELSTSRETQTLIREQFETKFFGPVNVIKAVLPAMRARGMGHVMVLSDISEYFFVDHIFTCLLGRVDLFLLDHCMCKSYPIQFWLSVGHLNLF